MKSNWLTFVLSLSAIPLGCTLTHAAPAAGISEHAQASASALVCQPDADAALAWLKENYPPGSDLRFDLDFLVAANDAFADPINPSVRLYVYTSKARTANGHPLWTAWVGVENDELVVVLIDAAQDERR